MKAKPTTIDEYLATLIPGQRAALQRLRTTILAAAPGATECISYGLPAFCHRDRVLMHIGAAAKHCAIYPGAGPIAALEAELKGYSTSKGTLRFPPDDPPPAALVRKLVKARIAENAARAAKARPKGKPAVKVNAKVKARPVRRARTARRTSS